MTTTFDEKNNTLLVSFINHMSYYGNSAEDMGFKAKDEFHTTVLGYKAGEIIGKSLRNTVLKDLFLKAIAEYEAAISQVYHIHIPQHCEMRIIEKHYDKGTRKSLILMLPPDEHRTKFYHKMEALFPDVKDHLPIPHITIGVDSNHPGIGLTQHVWDNELSSNFEVASPGDLRQAQNEIDGLRAQMGGLQDQLEMYQSQDGWCGHCDQCYQECSGRCEQE